jgi:hypothetical protein
MNRSVVKASALLALGLSITFASDAESQNCTPPPIESIACAWGWGASGDGTTDERHTPVQVQNLSGVTAVAAGYDFSFALKADGTVWAWGTNDIGQLGDGSVTGRTTPVQVYDLSGVTAVAAGWSFSFALKADGTVWAWGDNNVGQLGDGTTDGRHTPVQVQNLSGVTAVAAGAEHSLALKNDGTVWAWGSSNAGALDNGTGSGNDRHTPVQVQNLSEVTAVAAGIGFSLALKRDGMVWGWGYNHYGQLGDGTTDDRHTPVQVLSNVTAVAARGFHSLAVATGLPYLTVLKVLVHPDHNHLRLFNLKIDGVVVRADVNSGSTGRQLVSAGNHTVSETGGGPPPGTPLSAFTRVIGGDCAADGTVNLALGDQKTCTITNYDKMGGCPTGSRCCEPGEGTQVCQRCVVQQQACP